MGKIIQKINKLKNPENFFQINTIKGFKYIDKAGEIVNEYHTNDEFPKFSMGLEGLIIQNPREKIEILKVTSQTIWMKFSEVDSLDMTSRIFSEEASKIVKILEIEKISRVGWRNYFIYDFVNKEKQEEYFKKLISIKNLKLSVANFKITTDKKFDINLIIQPVVKNDGQKTPGVLFDVDIFQTDNLEIDKISSILESFRNYILDEKGLVEILNETFL